MPVLFPEFESATLEFKREMPAKNQLAKTIVAFCNLFGGRLVLGVNQDRTIRGLSDDQVATLSEQIPKSIYDQCSPPIIPSLYAQRMSGKLVLTIEVPAGMNKPYFIASEGLSRGTYIRVGGNTLRAGPEIIEELRWQSHGRFADERPIFAAGQDSLDQGRIRSFLENRITGFSGKLTPEILKSYKILVDEQSRLLPSLGGLLCFGKEPQQFLPEASTLMTRFKGISGREALDSSEQRGTIFEQFTAAFDFVVRQLKVSFSIRGRKREERTEVPIPAIREVLLNAFAHRNYTIAGPTKIAVFEDRIEVFSPGGFPGPLTADNLLKGVTFIRNSVTCRILRESGYIEKLGTGFPTIFSSYSDAGLQEPRVVDGGNFVKCILPRGRKKNLPLRDAADQTLKNLFQTKEEVTPEEVKLVLGVSRATATRKLAELLKAGLVVRLGKGPAVRYRLS